MIETVLSGVILAALGGLSFLAYNHPAAYAKIFLPIAIGLGAVMFGTTMWFLGTVQAHIALMPLVAHNKFDAETGIYMGAQNLVAIICGGCIVALLYLGFLTTLPYLGAVRENDHRRQDAPGESDSPGE